ncbi:MAG: PAS domain-containing protein [Phycisphaerae bacterium]|nr:PAS domain-containing protein [Phycisphaerae bacterium]
MASQKGLSGFGNTWISRKLERLLLTRQHGEFVMDVIDRIDKSLKVAGVKVERLHPIGQANSITSRYRYFFEGLGSAAAIYRAENDGRDFIFVDFNKAAEEIDNISRSDVIGRNIADVFPKTRATGLIDIFTRVYETSKPESFHVRLLKDGVITGWRSNYVYKLSSGEIVAVYSSDTKRRQMDQQAIAYHKKLRELASELSLSEERQRRKIAANLHDQLSQWLAISVMKLGFIRDSVDSKAAEELDEISETICKSIDSVRGLIYDLSSSTLYRFGLEAAVFEYVNTLLKKYDNIDWKFVSGRETVNLPEDISVLLFQSVRELLFNIIKYAKASHVVVEMQICGDYYEVKVSDDGVGFDVSSAGCLKRSGGFGLFHMAERLEHVGGELQIDSQPSNASRFCLRIPYSN